MCLKIRSCFCTSPKEDFCNPVFISFFHCVKGWEARSKAPRDAEEWIDVVRRTRDADVDAAIELDVIRQRVSEPDVHRSDPVRACFRADQAEELHITGEVVHDVVAEGDRVAEFGVMTAPAGVAIEVKLR